MRRNHQDVEHFPDFQSFRMPKENFDNRFQIGLYVYAWSRSDCHTKISKLYAIGSKADRPRAKNIGFALGLRPSSRVIYRYFLTLLMKHVSASFRKLPENFSKFSTFRLRSQNLLCELEDNTEKVHTMVKKFPFEVICSKKRSNSCFLLGRI